MGYCVIKTSTFCYTLISGDYNWKSCTRPILWIYLDKYDIFIFNIINEFPLIYTIVDYNAVHDFLVIKAKILLKSFIINITLNNCNLLIFIFYICIYKCKWINNYIQEFKVAYQILSNWCGILAYLIKTKVSSVQSIDYQNDATR